MHTHTHTHIVMMRVLLYGQSKHTCMCAHADTRLIDPSLSPKTPLFSSEALNMQFTKITAADLLLEIVVIFETMGL